MKKYFSLFLGILFMVVGIVGISHRAYAYAWCFAQTDAGVVTYSREYLYDFGSNGGVMRCSDNGWVTSPGAMPSSQVGTLGMSAVSWPAQQGATMYTVIVSEDPDFRTIALTQNVTGISSATLMGLKPNTRYYFHAYGTTEAGMKTPWSRTMTFTTSAQGSAGGAASTNMRWVDEDGRLVSPSRVTVRFTDAQGNDIFPESTWKKYGPDTQ